MTECGKMRSIQVSPFCMCCFPIHQLVHSSKQKSPARIFKKRQQIRRKKSKGKKNKTHNRFLLTSPPSREPNVGWGHIIVNGSGPSGPIRCATKQHPLLVMRVLHFTHILRPFRSPVSGSLTICAVQRAPFPLMPFLKRRKEKGFMTNQGL